MAEPYDPEAYPVRSNRYSGASSNGLLPNAARPGSTSSPPGGMSQQQSKMQAIQVEVDATKRQLEDNFMKIQERGELMEHLQTKTDNLAIQSKAFSKEATKKRREMWWKNTRWTILIGILILMVIAGAVAGGIKGKEVVEKVIHETVTPINATSGSASSTGTGTGTSTGTSTSTAVATAAGTSASASGASVVAAAAVSGVQAVTTEINKESSV